jgi:uncharacterized membrane protein YuzA (DUF378 family)
MLVGLAGVVAAVYFFRGETRGETKKLEKLGTVTYFFT